VQVTTSPEISIKTYVNQTVKKQIRLTYKITNIKKLDKINI